MGLPIKKEIIKRNVSILKAIVLSKNFNAYLVLLYRAISLITKPIDWMLHVVENLFIDRILFKEPIVIFVVGSHRSGATFVSQVIGSCFPLYNLGNFNSLFPRSRYIIHKIIRKKIFKSPKNSYSNYYGQSPGLFEIGDTHEVWDQWYGNNHNSVPDNIDLDIKLDMKNYFSSLYHVANSPIITKCGRNSLTLAMLNEQFKKGLFIIVDRELKDIVLSTLKANKIFNDGRGMWGLHSGSTKVGTRDNYIDNVVIQCIKVKNKIKEQIDTIDLEKYLVVNYDDFCNEPKACLDAIGSLIYKQSSVSSSYNFNHNSVFSSTKYPIDIKLHKDVEASIKRNKSLIRY